MSKTLYFYSDPNDATSPAMRTQISASGVAFTELNLAADARKHNVSRGGPMVLIDVDGKAFQELSQGVTAADITAAFNSAPSTLPAPLPAVVESAKASTPIIQRPLPLSKPSGAPTNRELMEALIKIYDSVDELKGKKP